MKILLARCYTARSSKETLVGSPVRTVNVQACVPYHHAGSLKVIEVRVLAGEPIRTCSSARLEHRSDTAGVPGSNPGRCTIYVFVGALLYVTLHQLTKEPRLAAGLFLLVGRFELVVLATRPCAAKALVDFHFYEVGDSRNPVGVGGQDLEAMYPTNETNETANGERPGTWELCAVGDPAATGRL